VGELRLAEGDGGCDELAPTAAGDRRFGYAVVRACWSVEVEGALMVA